ncbi:MAG: hypothetical protein ACR2G5_00140 [Pyrinomonadaceae bacterium]
MFAKATEPGSTARNSAASFEFISAGGLATSREKEKAEIVEERRRLRQEQMSDHRRSIIGTGELQDPRGVGIASARELLKYLLD